MDLFDWWTEVRGHVHSEHCKYFNHCILDSETNPSAQRVHNRGVLGPLACAMTAILQFSTPFNINVLGEVVKTPSHGRGISLMLCTSFVTFTLNLY